MTVPDNLTTWQWAFEHLDHSPTLYASPVDQGSYINALTNERLNFLSVKDNATQLGTALIKEHGFLPGDTISLFSTNTIWYPVAMWATVRAGGRVNGASPAYSAEEMGHALRTAKTKFLFTLPGSLDVAVQAAEAVGMSRDRIFLLEGQKQGFLNIRDLVTAGRRYDPAPAWSIPEGKSSQDVCGVGSYNLPTPRITRMLIHLNSISIFRAEPPASPRL